MDVVSMRRVSYQGQLPTLSDSNNLDEDLVVLQVFWNRLLLHFDSLVVLDDCCAHLVWDCSR